MSSIKFRKIKIDKDDRKVNRTGTQDLPILIWPTSPKGPNQINSTSIIRRMAMLLSLTDAEALSTNTCNSWDIVLSESYSVSNIGNTEVILDLILSNHDGWLTQCKRTNERWWFCWYYYSCSSLRKSIIFFYPLLLVTRNLL